MPTWQYQSVQIITQANKPTICKIEPDGNVESDPIAFFNGLGIEGWELVNIYEREGASNEFRVQVAYFKRPRHDRR